MNIMKYREADRNQSAKRMLLTAAKNGPGGKGDKPPDEWFKDKEADYFDRTSFHATLHFGRLRFPSLRGKN
jgi:hypothetical protein